MCVEHRTSRNCVDRLVVSGLGGRGPHGREVARVTQVEGAAIARGRALQRSVKGASARPLCMRAGICQYTVLIEDHLVENAAIESSDKKVLE